MLIVDAISAATTSNTIVDPSEFLLNGSFVDGCATRMNNKWLSVMQSKYGTSQPSVLSSALGIGFSTFVNKSLHEHEHQYKYYYYYIICLKWHLAILTGQKPMTPFTDFYMKSIMHHHQMKSFVAPFPYESKNKLGQRRYIYFLRMPGIIK